MKSLQDFTTRKNEAVAFRYDIFCQISEMAVKPIRSYEQIEDWQKANDALAYFKSVNVRNDTKAKRFIECYNVADFESCLDYWDFN